MARRSPAPGTIYTLLGLGHATWGAIAYRRGLRAIREAGVLDSVGDGLFKRDHSQDERAAGFWFMFTAPLVGILGQLVNRAHRAGDVEAVEVVAASTLALSAAGAAVIPRSGFPAGVALSAWILRQARRQ